MIYRFTLIETLCPNPKSCCSQFQNLNSRQSSTNNFLQIFVNHDFFLIFKYLDFWAMSLLNAIYCHITSESHVIYT